MAVIETPLPVLYFDGRHAKPTEGVLRIEGEGRHAQAVVSDAAGGRVVRFAVRAARWPERTRHGVRVVSLPDDGQGHPQGQLQARDSAAYDQWAARALPRRESLLVRAQQSWRGTLLALVLLCATVVMVYLHGLPVAARGLAALVPTSVDEALGRGAMAQVDGDWMQPSELPAATRERLERKFAAAVRQAHPQGAPAYQLVFRRSQIGPNAFALPGGTIVLTDELVELVQDDEVLLGVLGHELGHVTARHGVRQLVQAATIQAALSLAFGDYGSLLTVAPLVLGTMAYSRDFEREADEDSIRFMQANGISPLVMVKFFQRVRGEQSPETQKTPLGIAILSSHPSDEERMARFRQAALSR